MSRLVQCLNVHLAVISILLMTTALQNAFATDDAEWTDLFNGKDLTNWKNPYSWGKAEVLDGEIHLTTKKSKWFLSTVKEYSDFIFEVEVIMPEGKCNSGFMFRSHKAKNRMFGYQAEVDPSDRKWSGGLYDEGRRGWFISPNRDHAKSNAEKNDSIKTFRDRAGECFKRYDWNKYRIECRGDHIQIFVNGVKTTDIHDSKDSKGYIALQHHGEKGKVYRFRNIRIQELNGGSDAETSEWISLFDGKTLSGWSSRNGKAPVKGWVVEDGVIHRKSGGGDIVTEQEYEDFELELEWKISPKGNSGIKYRFDGKLGPEYQVLDDDGHSNGKNPFTSAGAMYLMAKPNDQKELKPVGEWNKARIVAKGQHLEHWLNGSKIIEMDVGSDAWNQIKAKTKFRNAKGYGEGAGKILLQDHQDPVWYRNIRIRKL